jgi:general secretion pathway protein K
VFKELRNSRGIILLVTLATVTILITVAMSLNRLARSLIVSTATTRNNIELMTMAESGIELGKALLIKDGLESRIDSVQEDWANPEIINELLAELDVPQGRLNVFITDELAKLQVNALVTYPEANQFNAKQQALWQRFIENRIARLAAVENQEVVDLPEETEPTIIVNALKDWLDKGDDGAITGLSGAEVEYYQGLTPPYLPRNGPMVDIDELLLIKGISAGLFHGTSTIPGIKQFITVHGISEKTGGLTFGGKININTAELPVLIALMPPETEELAQSIYDYRMEASDTDYLHDLSDPKWYRNAPGCGDLKIDPELITTSSDLFRIVSIAQKDTAAIAVSAVLRRTQNEETGKVDFEIQRWAIE